MISKFHINSIKTRFPKSYESFVKDGGVDEWSVLMDWISYKGQTRGSYSIMLRRIENEL